MLRRLTRVPPTTGLNNKRFHRLDEYDALSLHNLKELNLCLVFGGPFDVTREDINEPQAVLAEATMLC